jgi:Tol biopolymer transport system component
MNRQKILISLIGITSSASLVLAGYLIQPEFFSSLTGQFLDKVKIPQEISIKSEVKNLEKLNNERVISPIAISSSLIRYYEINTGKVFDINVFNGEKTAISSNSLKNFIRTIWSPNKNEVVSIFSSSSGGDFKYYNYETKRTSTISKSLKALTFSPSGEYIAYIQDEEEEKNIYISTPDGTAPKKIFTTRISNIKIYWPDEKWIYLLAGDPDTGLSDLFKLDKDGNLVRIFAGIFRPELNWSKDGKTVLISYFNKNQKLSLTTYDLEDNTTSLETSTWASKCTWKSDGINIVCGVPKVIANELERTVSQDDIVEINTQTGDKKIIFNSDQPKMSVREIILTTDETKTVILNEYDSLLYVLN